MQITPEQEKLELDMIGYGIDAYRSAQRAAVERGQASDTVPMRRLAAVIIDPLTDAITKFVHGAHNTGKPGRRNLAAKYLAQFNPEVVALIAIRRMLDHAHKTLTVTSFATDIGNALRMEKRLEMLIEADPDRYQTVSRNFKTNHKAHRARVYGFHLKDASIDLDWSYKDILRVGTKLVELVVEITGLFTLYRVSGKKKRYYEVRPTERLMTWIRDQDSKCESLKPFWMPTLMPPKPWDENGLGGGYYIASEVTFDAGPFGLYKGHKGAPSVTVIEALNTVQSTPWRVNAAVLGVLQHTWEHGHEIGSVPARDFAPMPPCPKCGGYVETKAEGGHQCLNEDPELRKEWRKIAAVAWSERLSQNDRRTQVTKAIGLAERFSEAERFYFPHKLDFRGRMYPMPSHLQPQGPDYVRGLLEFAEGKPIDDERGLGWLMVHGANLWGNDKVSMEDRIAWVEENNAEITRSGLDPLGCRFWTEADKPWQFLAFCLEFVAFKKVGYGFVSHLPITVDGSCNGLQHFSAMLRDEVGGAAVNLVPQDEPADVYQQVADVVIDRLGELVDRAHTCHCGEDMRKGCGLYGSACTAMADQEDHEVASQAQQWLNFGITRKTTKRSVMIVPYSGTISACRRYILDHIRERRSQWPGGDPPFESDVKSAMFLAKHVWAAIATVIRSSREVMQWLRTCAKVHAKTNEPLIWVNPLGFPMTQEYADFIVRSIETRFGDQLRLELSYKEEKPGTIRASKQMNGISPNFVHSMDACALMQTVLYGKDNGITSWMLIHDCYGTHAADMDMLAACLREAFVDLYKEHDPLQSFYEQILEQIPEEHHKDVPPPPTKGKLNLGMVRHSDFFFA